jgi:Ca2+-binding RTX toxin-like protein
MIDLHDSFVTSLYIGLLDRKPDEDGHQYWVNALTSGSMTQEQVAQEFLNSEEYRARSADTLPPQTETILLELHESFVTSLYFGLLGREPDENGYQYWVNALTSGAWAQEQVTQAFLDSQEYQARLADQVLPPTETIQTLYSNAFDRPADEQGLTYWASQVTPQNSLANVVCQILSVASDPENNDGQLLSNKIDAVRNSMQISTTPDVSDGYRMLGELDVVTSDKASVALYTYLDETRLGAPATSSGAVQFDNVIKGDDLPGTTLEGTNLNDLIILGTQTAIVYGLNGNDLFQGTNAGTYFYPGNGNDTVEAGAGADTIDARSDSPATQDRFYGQDGDDTIFGGAGDEFIDGGDGNDSINAGAGKDVIRGGTGNDQIVKTGGGIFTILGEAGNDIIQVSSGAGGQIDGGLGNDRIEVTDLTVGGVGVYAQSGDDIVKLENVNLGSFVFLGDGNNQFIGSNISNLDITATSGNDTLTLRNGKNVTVDLGSGNNKIELFNCENVTVITGSGQDSFTVKNSSNITLKAGDGSDYFNVDAASFKTGTVKLDGGRMPADGYIRNWLTIDDLGTGDRLVFDKDSFRQFSDLTFDHSVRASLIFEPQYGFGLEYRPIQYSPGKTTPPGSTMDIHNVNGVDIARLQSEVWFMQGTTPFSQTEVGFTGFGKGDWYTSSWGENLLMFNNGFSSITNNISFVDVTEDISNPYVFNGNLMLSWII